MDRAQILGAPAFFPTVWGWIKKWFDPITTSKIFILAHHEVLPTLTQFMDIENIPKKYGGKLDFECGKMPVLDPQVRDCLALAPGPDTEKFLLTGPVRWINENDEGEMTALGVGSLDGQQRQTPVATLHSLMTRIATHESQKAMQESGPLSSHDQPPLAGGQAPISDHAPVNEISAAPVSEPLADTSSAPVISNPPTSDKLASSSEAPAIEASPSKDLAAMSVSDPPKVSLANGGPPGDLAIPEPLSPMEATKTEFMTPPNDPEVNRQLQ